MPFRMTAAAVLMVLGLGVGGCGQLQEMRSRWFSPLAATFEAHGGLEQWRRQGSFTYTLVGFPLSQQVARAHTATADLHKRWHRVDGDGFTTGYDGEHAWSLPGPKAVGLPVRFFTLGSFYFIAMPFVFADDGVIAQAKGEGTFRGQTYRTVQVRYRSGVGYTSEDDYVLFIDPQTNRLALIHHGVTEDPDVERVTWVFEQWQEVAGLLVPAQMTFYGGWNPDDPGDGATFSITNVSFGEQAPDRSIFAPPPGAKVDQ